MDKTLEKICNGKIRKDKKSVSLSKGIVKEILLQRYAHSQNNTDLLCQLIENNYISRDSIWEHFGEKKLAYSNDIAMYFDMISAAADVIVTNQEARRLFEYFICREYEKELVKFKYVLDKDGCIISYKGNNKNREIRNISKYFLVLHSGVEMDLGFNQMLNHMEDTLFYERYAESESISSCLEELLGEKGITEGKLFSRFCEKRTLEIFKYIIKKHNLNIDLKNTYEKLIVIAMSVVPILRKSKEESKVISNLISLGLLKEVTITSENRLKETDGKELALDADFLYGYRTASCSGASEILRITIGDEYKIKETLADRIFIKYFADEEGINTVMKIYTTTLCEYLIETIETHLLKGDTISKEGIVRGTEMSETDIEFFLANLKCNLLTCLFAEYIKLERERSYDDSDLCSVVQRCEFNMCSDDDEFKGTYKNLNNELSKIKIEKENLAIKNKELEEEIEQLKVQIQKQTKADAYMKELKETNELLKNEVIALQEANERTRRNFEFYEREKYGAKEDVFIAEMENIPDNFFADKKVIIVGGRWEVNSILEEIMPKSRIVYNATDSLLNVNNYDCVFFFTEYLNHTVYNKYVSSCRVNNKPMFYLYGSNIENLKRDIYKIFTEQIKNT